MIDSLIKCILQSSLICSIGIVLVMILRKNIFNYYSQSFKYYIWLPIILKLLIPFKISIYIPEKLYNNFHHIPNYINQRYTENSPVIYTNFKIIDTFFILFYIWLLVALFLVAYNIYIYFSFANKVKYLSYDIVDDNIVSIYHKLLYELNIHKNIHLKYCPGINSPLGIGIFHKCILIPEMSYNINELEWILKHELIHFKKHDILYKILVLISLIIHWFNPLVYIMFQIINTDCELACDEILLKDSDIKSRQLYAMIFLDSLRLNKNKKNCNKLITGFNINQNILKRRIENMLNSKKRRKGLLLGALAIGITVSSFVSVKTFAVNNTTTSLNPETSKITANYQNQNLSEAKQNNDIQNDGETLKNGLKVVYRGTLADMPENLKKPSVVKAFSDGNWKIVVTSGYKHYTYTTAPADVKAQYEADCKAANKTPNPSDPIYVP